MADLTLVQFKYNDMAPAGALYLACGLEKEGVDFDLKLYPVVNIDPDRLYSFLNNSEKILAIGCMTDMLPYLMVSLQKIKKRFPQKTIILGGTGPAPSAEIILKRFDFIDFIIKGDGTFALPSLIKAIKNREAEFSDIRGLVYRNKGKIVSNPYDLYPNNRISPAYHRIKPGEYDEYTVNTSWGCPHNCTFCDSRPMVGRKIEYRDLSDIIEQIKLIKKLLKRKDIIIHIADEAFLENRGRVVRFCYLLKKDKINIRWTCYGRIDRADKDLLEIMSGTGCSKIYYGVESGSNRILEKIKKGSTIEQAIEILILSKKYIETVIASFIFRYPFEAHRDFIQTLSAIRYLQSKNIRCHLYPLAPVSRSQIFTRYKNDLRFSSTAPCAINILSDMPKECIALIKSNKGIFYNYFYYHPPELPEIMRAFYKFQSY